MNQLDATSARIIKHIQLRPYQVLIADCDCCSCPENCQPCVTESIIVRTANLYRALREITTSPSELLHIDEQLSLLYDRFEEQSGETSPLQRAKEEDFQKRLLARFAELGLRVATDDPTAIVLQVPRPPSTPTSGLK